MLNQVFAAFVIAVSPLLAGQALAADLTITVEGGRSDSGLLLLCVFSEASSDVNAFPDCEGGKPVRSQKVNLSGGKTAVTYTGLKDGTYAVAMVHDENGNGKLDTNFLGIPSEGIGISNNPRLFGKPTFQEAKFTVNGKTAITVTIKYVL